MLDRLHRSDEHLTGRKVLVVDDDIRNIYALTGALEQHGMIVINAENGKDGIEMLKKRPDLSTDSVEILEECVVGIERIRAVLQPDRISRCDISIIILAEHRDNKGCQGQGAKHKARYNHGQSHGWVKAPCIPKVRH